MSMLHPEVILEVAVERHAARLQEAERARLVKQAKANSSGLRVSFLKRVSDFLGFFGSDKVVEETRRSDPVGSMAHMR